MDVAGWLRSLGLGQYEAAFRDNEVDDTVLPRLTVDDLKDLGVAIVGHRRKIMSAIEELNAAAPAGADVAKASLAQIPVPTGAASDAAERRQLTIMFCDLVGSTAMSARLDPEDMRSIIANYQKTCTHAVEEEQGFVAKYMGDGLLAYFGYPRAHEDDAERAVRAGLAITEALPSLAAPPETKLHVRVGIATGIVVVGDLVGSGESQERGVVGDTPNLAARLQGIAQPDQVVVAEATRQLIGDLFELDDLGPQGLKGVAAPVRAYAVQRVRPVESRFDAMHSGDLTALVGREEESQLLLRHWAKATAGDGQVVLVSGEAGIGKSRLTVALMDQLALEPHIRLRYFCSSQRTDSALYPIIGQMERAAGLFREEDLKAKLDKFDALLMKSATSREDAGLLADMLSLANDGRYPQTPLTPQQRRQKTLEALILQIEALSRERPVLMIFEDAHWGDPSSLELFGRLVDRIEHLKVLLIVTFRAEFKAPWVGRPHVSTMLLNRMTKRQIDVMVQRVVAGSRLTESMRRDIVERADGVPLFAEEIAKAALESESEGLAAQTIAAIPSPRQAIPASLHASLMARLDRLGPAKEIAQMGAAIGREFSHALLVAAAGKSEPELEASLDHLVQAGLLFRHGEPPHAVYLFKHALVQDAAYGTLLREPRRALHSRIAEAMESQFPDVAATQPELLAHHCAAAGLTEKAAILWGKASKQSLARSALAEAEAQFTRALALIASLPGTPALRREQFDLQVGLANAQMHTKGYASVETKASFDKARSLIHDAELLGERVEDPLAAVSVLYGFWVGNFMAFNGTAMRELSDQLLVIAKAQAQTTPLILCTRLVGLSRLLTGDITQGLSYLNQSFVYYNPIEHLPYASRFGQDLSTPILTWRSLANWLLGYPERAIEDANRALEDARTIKHDATIMYVLANTIWFHLLSGNYATVESQLHELVEMATARGAKFWILAGKLFRECEYILEESNFDRSNKFYTAIEEFRSTGTSAWIPFHYSLLALSYSKTHRLDQAKQYMDDAILAMEISGQRWLESELHRTAAVIALAPVHGDVIRAQYHLEKALAVARSQQARSLELRAATSLARLWRHQGKAVEGREVLSPVYNWFTEGFDTPDLKEAKALLDELRA